MAKKQAQQNYNYSTEREALDRVKKQQFLYERNLVGKSFLYSYVDNDNTIQFKELKFEKENYLHLTGLDYQNRQTLKRNGQPNIGSNSIEFYERLSENDTTLINDISFIKGSTPNETALYFKHTQHKLDNLSQLTTISNKAEYIGKYSGKQAFDVIINKNLNSIAFKQEGDLCVPVSSLFGKAESVAKNVKPIVAIFSKEHDGNDYRIKFISKKALSNVDKADFTAPFLKKLSLDSFANNDVSFNSDALTTIRHRFIVSNVKSELSDLAQKRLRIYDTDTGIDEYTNMRDIFIEHLNSYNEVESDENKGEIVKVITADYKEQLSKDDALVNADLIPQEEISKINEVYSKYHHLNLSINLGEGGAAFSSAAEIANSIKAPSAQLLKKKISNFSLLPERRENDLYRANLHSAQLQGGAIALKMPNPQPSFEETINNIISRLSEVAQKISDFLNHTDKPFVQEQPPQARTAHERKINTELPFPKQKPTDERTEPITAKQEKARKPEIKSTEKLSSWFGKQLSSAKHEADEHNKNNEPKAHNKDRSL